MERYLQEFGLRGDQSILMFPDDALRSRVECEIGERSGARPSILAATANGEAAQELSRRWIPAGHHTFVPDTLIMVEEVAAELKRIGASQFELAFGNVTGVANPQSDRIVIGIRYVA